jgi:23S rRNA pseudouridine1911/1915/1917 synthase
MKRLVKELGRGLEKGVGSENRGSPLEPATEPERSGGEGSPLEPATEGRSREGSPLAPSFLETAKDFLLIYKPPRMHCSPGKGPCLLDWAAESFPEIKDLRGRRPGEGGLLHRLDFETRGLVLIARRQEALDALLRQQEEGVFTKDYAALSAGGGPGLPGFPPVPGDLLPFQPPSPGQPLIVESPFRAWGPGRKAVRPGFPPDRGGSTKKARRSALDRGLPYRTEITALEREGDLFRFQVRLRRGFRHQIRCHLAWLGFPLLNDGLYGGEDRGGFLALSAQGLSFLDPSTGEERRFDGCVTRR